MKKIVFITPDEAEYGFQLAGVSQIVSDEENIETVIREVTGQSESGLIIVDERLLKAFTEEELQKIEEAFPGIILDLPAPERPEIEIEDYAARLIKRAIGYHVKLTL
jgi:V/A-type H+-transporting ATPase subunit F